MRQDLLQEVDKDESGAANGLSWEETEAGRPRGLWE